jgi:Fe-S-cluster containining protein
MTELTRQQRRKAHREYVKLGRAALATGLSPRPQRETVLGVALLFKAKLTERGNNRCASEVAGMAHALIEKALDVRPSATALACRKGCAYCCHSFVGVIAPEVFRLADAVRASTRSALAVGAVRARCSPLKGVAPQDRIGAKLPCPLLIEGLCGVYADRPMVCRQTTSLSLEACLDEYEDRNRDAQVPVSPLHLAHAGNVHVALLAALHAVDLPADAHELSGALDLALTMPDAEQRWLAGEDVFRDLPNAVQRPRDLDAVARRIAEEITL